MTGRSSPYRLQVVPRVSQEPSPGSLRIVRDGAACCYRLQELRVLEKRAWPWFWRWKPYHHWVTLSRRDWYSIEGYVKDEIMRDRDNYLKKRAERERGPEVIWRSE